MTGGRETDAEQVVFVSVESDVFMARKLAREVAVREGLSRVAVEALATAVSEVARNILVHAGAGEVCVARCTTERGHGVVVTARDNGQGMADVERALQDGFSTVHTLGFGLAGARRLVDEFEIVSSAGQGTTVVLRKFAGGRPDE